MHTTPAPAGVVNHGAPVAILFGSQTGVALGVARRLHQRLTDASVRATLTCLNQFAAVLARRPAVVVVVSSTFLDGGAPDNAADFKAFLDDGDPVAVRAMFAPVAYAVVGVGDSRWPKFAQFARDVDARLAACGARPLLSRLDADSADEAQRQTDVDRWIGALFDRVVPDVVAAADIEETSCEPCCHLRCPRAGECDDADAGPGAHFAAARRLYGDGVHGAVLVHSAYLCRAQGRRVLHLEFEVPADCVYEPGEAVAVPCANPAGAVQSLLTILDLDADAPVSVPSVAGTCTLSWALTYCLDLCSAPSQAVLGAVSRLSATRDAGEVPDGARNIVDLFAKCRALRPAADELVLALDPLTPRYYSIASSPYRHPNRIHLTVAISGAESRTAAPCVATHGLCTGYFESCHAQRCSRGADPVSVPLFIRSNRSLKLPCFDRPSSHSLVMIGCGVGIAPFRAFLQHIPEGTVKAYLFFGFRDNQDEYLYKDEWGRSPAIEFIEVAFSRLESSRFRYVQDALKARAADLVDLINAGAIVYVCGALSMATDVYECFLSDILAGAGGLSRLDAITVMEKKIVQGRYMVEAWD